VPWTTQFGKVILEGWTRFRHVTHALFLDRFQRRWKNLEKKDTELYLAAYKRMHQEVLEHADVKIHFTDEKGALVFLSYGIRYSVRGGESFYSLNRTSDLVDKVPREEFMKRFKITCYNPKPVHARDFLTSNVELKKQFNRRIHRCSRDTTGIIVTVSEYAVKILRGTEILFEKTIETTKDLLDLKHINTWLDSKTKQLFVFSASLGSVMLENVEMEF